MQRCIYISGTSRQLRCPLLTFYAALHVMYAYNDNMPTADAQKGIANAGSLVRVFHVFWPGLLTILFESIGNTNSNTLWKKYCQKRYQYFLTNTF